MKIKYCARCGRIIESYSVVWQDDRGLIFRYHGMCAVRAAKQRDEELAKLAELKKWGGG